MKKYFSACSLLITALCVLCCTSCVPLTYYELPGTTETNRALVTIHPIHDPSSMSNEVIWLDSIDGQPLSKINALWVPGGTHEIRLRYGIKQAADAEYQTGWTGGQIVTTTQYSTYLNTLTVTAKPGKKYTITGSYNIMGENTVVKLHAVESEL